MANRLASLDLDGRFSIVWYTPRAMAFPAPKDWLSSPWIPRAAAAAGLVGLALVYLATQRTFTILTDGQRRQVATHAGTVARGLQDAGFTLNAGDVVVPALSSALQPGMTIEIRRAFPVKVDFDGEVQTVQTTSRVPENILALAGVRVYPGDRILVDGLPAGDPSVPLPGPPGRLAWSPGVPMTIETSSGEVQIHTSAATVGGALHEAGFKLYRADDISPGPETPIRPAMSVVYKPSHEIEIAVDGETVHARSSAARVGEALGQAGVSLVGLDFARPAVDQPLPDDAKISVVRVTEQVKVELTPIAFGTQYQPLSDLEIDRLSIIKLGSYGVEAHQVRVRYEDGEETRQTEEGSWVAKAPDPRIEGYGTNIVIRTVSTDDGRIEYWRAVQMWATSYSASRAGVSPDARNYGITASGKPLTKGLVAIDRRYIPFGTQMYVPGYGYALAADTGGGVKGRWIDLGYDDDNYVPWHQYVTVYFLTPVPPEGSIVWIFPP